MRILTRERLNDGVQTFLRETITVAQIKIAYMCTSGRVGDLACARGIERSSKQAYINRIISTTRSNYNETLHNIGKSAREELKPIRSQQSLLASTRPDHMGIVPLSEHLSRSIIISDCTTLYRAEK
jgi:hypothetical protein